MVIQVRYSGPCKSCGAMIQAGERANWLKGRGLFHRFNCKTRRPWWTDKPAAHVGQYGAGANWSDPRESSEQAVTYRPCLAGDEIVDDEDELRGYVRPDLA